jgi:hypothetical protein
MRRRLTATFRLRSQPDEQLLFAILDTPGSLDLTPRGRARKAGH